MSQKVNSKLKIEFRDRASACFSAAPAFKTFKVVEKKPMLVMVKYRWRRDPAMVFSMMTRFLIRTNKV